MTENKHCHPPRIGSFGFCATVKIRHRILGRALPVAEVQFGEVFGRRPSQVAREARGRRTETSQARTRAAQVRRYGDLRILVELFRRRGDCAA